MNMQVKQQCLTVSRVQEAWSCEYTQHTFCVAAEVTCEVTGGLSGGKVQDRNQHAR